MAKTGIPRIFCPCGTEIFRKPKTGPRGGSAPTYCPPCAKERVRARIRANNARARAGVKPVTDYTCSDCKRVFPRVSRSGPLPQRCPDCFAEFERLRLLTWNAEHPEQRSAHNRKSVRKRRALLRGATVEDFEVLDIYERDSWRCQLCRKKVSKKLEWPHPYSASLDHIVPLSRGGAHARANVQLAHLRCNLSKHTRPAGEQMLLIG